MTNPNDFDPTALDNGVSPLMAAWTDVTSVPVDRYFGGEEIPPHIVLAPDEDIKLGPVAMREGDSTIVARYLGETSPDAGLNELITRVTAQHIEAGIPPAQAKHYAEILAIGIMAGRRESVITELYAGLSVQKLLREFGGPDAPESDSCWE